MPDSTSLARLPLGIGAIPGEEFIMGLPVEDRAIVAAAMQDVRVHGNWVAHHLRGETRALKIGSAGDENLHSVDSTDREGAVSLSG